MTPFFAGVGPATSTSKSSFVARLDTPTPSTHVAGSRCTFIFFVLSTHLRPWIDEYGSPSSLVSAGFTSGESTTQNTNATSMFGDVARIRSALTSDGHPP